MAARFERGLAMRRADGDVDAGFADFEAAKTMGHGDAVDGEERMKRGSDFAHFLKRHGFVGLVFEVESLAAVGLIAHAAVEGDDGTVLSLTDVFDESVGTYGIANEED